LDPAEDQVFIEELRKNLRVPLEIEEVDCNLEDIGAARALVESLDSYMKLEKRG